MTNSFELKKKIILRHQRCGILGFCSEQEGRFGEKRGRLITPVRDQSRELLLIQRHEIVSTEGHVSSRAPVVEKGRMIRKSPDSPGVQLNSFSPNTCVRFLVLVAYLVLHRVNGGLLLQLCIRFPLLSIFLDFLPLLSMCRCVSI